LLDKLIENLIFAMNFDDKVPEHILEEIFRHNKNKNLNTEHESEIQTVDEFNEEVDRKLGFVQAQDDAESLFNEVYGYGDLKFLLAKMVLSKQSLHAVLVGPPASGKTMFLLAIQQRMKDVVFIDATNASGAGIVDKLFSNHNTKIILIDEIEKMRQGDQNMLLNLLETGVLTSTKVKKTKERRFDGIKLFATSNDIDALSKPLKSRLIELHLPEYDFNEFSEIAAKLTERRDGHDREMAMKIADTVWNRLNSRDVRDMIQISKLTKSIDDVEFVANTLQKYRKKEHEGQDAYE
jgi:replication-associated recombination protein RarA